MHVMSIEFRLKFGPDCTTFPSQSHVSLNRRSVIVGTAANEWCPLHSDAGHSAHINFRSTPAQWISNSSFQISTCQVRNGNRLAFE